jgi:hypothetical protein
VLAIAGIIALLVVASIGTWLSIRSGQPATPSVYGTHGSTAGAVWTWDGTRYTLMPVHGAAPSSNHADMAYDRKRGLVVLWDHGCTSMVMGFQGGCSSQTNRTWTWDGSAWTVAATSSSPTAAGQGAMVFDNKLGAVVYANGAGQAWAWTGSAWGAVAMPGGPGSSGNASQTVAVGYDSGRDLLVLVSPTTTWSWDGAAWHSVPGGIGAGAGMGGVQLAYDAAQRQLVYVGDQSTWTWDGARWQHFEQAAVSAGGLGYDADRTTLMLVQQDSSACDQAACHTTTWAWSSTAWTQLPIENGPRLPLTRSGAFAIPMAFDDARSEVVLFASAT